MRHGFEKWYAEEGRFLDPDSSDVPLEDKIKGFMELGFEAGIKLGMAMAGNYTADKEQMPQEFNFANGVRVKLAVSRLDGPYLTIYRF